jgi:hypothetical protein
LLREHSIDYSERRERIASGNRSAMPSISERSFVVVLEITGGSTENPLKSSSKYQRITKQRPGERKS